MDPKNIPADVEQVLVQNSDAIRNIVIFINIFRKPLGLKNSLQNLLWHITGKPKTDLE